MAFALDLPAKFRAARWKVKIRDKESREPPHCTIIRGVDAWRINLRTKKFMDDNPDPDEVPSELTELITNDENWELLCEQWDQMYPNNPVSSDD